MMSSAAVSRCKSSARMLNELFNGKRSIMMDDVAAGIINAEHLLSGLCELYDGMYDDAKSRGLVERRPRNPLPGRYQRLKPKE
jgi:hypothetical protein